MSALRLAGALLFICCGWCAGDAVQGRYLKREAALRGTVELLRRVRQEVAYHRADLSALCRRLYAEKLLPADNCTLQNLPPPLQLTGQEAACFEECFSGLGRAGAQQECERLDYYIGRFEVFLAAAQRQTQSCAALSRRLGLAAGAVLALMLV